MLLSLTAGGVGLVNFVYFYYNLSYFKRIWLVAIIYLWWICIGILHWNFKPVTGSTDLGKQKMFSYTSKNEIVLYINK